MPKFALAGWHYAHRTLTQNAEFFLSHGFDVFSALGNHYVQLLRDPAESEKLAQILYDSKGGLLTVHYGLPDPRKPETVDPFLRSLEDIRAWQEKYHALHILSFDVWYPDIFPYVERAVTMFAGSGTSIAFEDYCINGARQWDEKNQKLLEKTPFYMLVDVAHMQLRLCPKGDLSKEAFRREMDTCPMPIIETHLSNNNGIKDMHAPLLNPELQAQKTNTPDMEQYFSILADMNLHDIILTVETMPANYGNVGAAADTSVLNDLRYVRALAEKVGL